MSGLVKIIAPFPAGLEVNPPTVLIATIFAKIDDPHGRLKGELCNDEMGIVQLAA